MGRERVKGQDSPPDAAVNAANLLAGKYRVTAKDGISIDAGRFEKGDEVELNGDVARALTNEGSVERA